MKKLLLAALGALFVIPAYAGDFTVNPPDRGYSTVLGDYVTFSTTNTVFDFGVESKAVQICSFHPGSIVYMRRGTKIVPVTGQTDASGVNEATADASRMTVAATSSTVFQDGNQAHPESAMPISTPSTLTSGENCSVYPIRTRGLIFNVDTAGTASLDVRVFAD